MSKTKTYRIYIRLVPRDGIERQWIYAGRVKNAMNAEQAANSWRSMPYPFHVFDRIKAKPWN